jgi:hypothetical protein
VVGSIQKVNRGAVATGTAADKVRNASDALSSESERLSGEIRKFVATIRAA